MVNISSIWTLVMHSNLFNFAIFLIILIAIAKKVDISAVMENMKNSVIQKIEDAKSTKSKAIEDLKNAEKSVEHLSQDIKDILTTAETNAKNMSSHILTEAENKVKSFEINASKLIEAEEKAIVSKLTTKQGMKSVDLAKQHIIQTLKNNPSLHNKFINDSIEDIDKVTL
ncbi:MAG: ATP synthase F0 subunit B [Clostridiaceae bacterium]|jgi:F0F1-type ATP synthase membrane subunit b/b'|nr:ATP synthase F0 subunit B [Clostridiaceae bacterium]